MSKKGESMKQHVSKRGQIGYSVALTLRLQLTDWREKYYNEHEQHSACQSAKRLFTLLRFFWIVATIIVMIRRAC